MKSKIILISIIFTILNGCSKRIMFNEKEVPLCYSKVLKYIDGDDSQIIVNYMSPYVFKDSTMITLIKHYKKPEHKTTLFFIQDFNDSIEVYFDNTLAMKDFLTSNYTKTEYLDLGDTVIATPHIITGNTCKSLTYDSEKNRPFPILTIKVLTKGKEDCMQIILDTRYSIVSIWKFGYTWQLSYQNFPVIFEHCGKDTIKLY